MYAHFDFLLSVGVHVPRSGIREGNGHLDIRRLFMADVERATQEDFFFGLKKEVDSSSADVFIISTESFWTVERDVYLKPLASFLGDIFDAVKVAFFTRDHVDLIASHYAQKVKAGVVSGSLREFLVKNESLYDFSHKNKVWGRFFGEENVCSFSFEVAVEAGVLNYFFNMAVSSLCFDPGGLKKMFFIGIAWLTACLKKSKRFSRCVGLENLLGYK